jgi:hypothetical protein
MKTCECQWDAHFGREAILGHADGAPNHPYKKKFRDAVVKAVYDMVPKCAACRDCHTVEAFERRLIALSGEKR